MECKSTEIKVNDVNTSIYSHQSPFMILVKKKADLQNLLTSYRSVGQTIGFVPTMGALHEGHLALINKSREQNDRIVCSIFINPTQFNNPTDFEKYPVTIEKDINLLEATGCDVLFLPSVFEMYPPGEAVVTYDLGTLENILEGKYRPGHFQGVCRIVDKLLDATKPDNLYLGQKDYQQCMVIGKMINLRKHQIGLQICDTLREPGGLAMSSRNLRLSEADKIKAASINETLRNLQHQLKVGDTQDLIEDAHRNLTNHSFEVDYVAIASAKDLSPIKTWDGREKAVALIAATINEVRLIDNIFLN